MSARPGLTVLALLLSLLLCCVSSQITAPLQQPVFNTAITSPVISNSTNFAHLNGGFRSATNNVNLILATCTTLSSQRSIEAILSQIGPNSPGGANCLNNQGANGPNFVRTAFGGFYNHVLYFVQMTAPDSIPYAQYATPRLQSAIQSTFGGLSGLQARLNAAATAQIGSGWVWLSVEGQQQNGLVVVGTPFQDNPLMSAIVSSDPFRYQNLQRVSTPILGIDVWEHAYFQDTSPALNNRTQYMNNYLRVVDWRVVNTRYSIALHGNRPAPTTLLMKSQCGGTLGHGCVNSGGLRNCTDAPWAGFACETQTKCTRQTLEMWVCQ